MTRHNSKMSLFSRLRAPTGGQGGANAPVAIGGEEQRSAEAHGNGEPAATEAAVGIANKSQQTLKGISVKAGVLLKTLKPGDITRFPKKGDVCTIHYEAFSEDEMIRNSHNPDPFDSSRLRDQVFHFRLGAGQVIEGMEAAVSRMSLGQTVEATIPYMYAYGVAGYPPVIQPRATLIFRIELIRFSSVI